MWIAHDAYTLGTESLPAPQASFFSTVLQSRRLRSGLGIFSRLDLLEHPIDQLEGFGVRVEALALASPPFSHAP